MMPAAVSELIPAFIRIGYSVASRITARFDALGITSESRFPSKNTIGTSIYTDLIFAIGFVSTFTVTLFAFMALIYAE